MIKILIVEDDSNKLAKVVQCLCQISDLDINNIVQVVDANSAKNHLRTTFFDLMILDISIPKRIDQLAEPDGGLKLLDELMERDLYVRPTHIIGITAFSEIFKEAQVRFSLRLLTILYFDATTIDWQAPLIARVKHIIASKSDSLTVPTEYNSFLAIICALDTLELNSILNLNWSWQQIFLPQDDTIFYKGQILKNDKIESVYVAACPRMGLPSASIVSMKLIMNFKPKYIAMTGITAGVKNKTNFGDIIVADPSWDWGAGKWSLDENKSIIFQPAPHQLPLDPSLRNKFKMARDNKEALLGIKRGWQGDIPNSELSIHIGPLASGAAVLADGETAKRIVLQHREVIGIEMETYGVFAAAYESPLPKPKAFSMKSVVDFADGEKNDKFQKYAAYTSAQGLKLFVEHYL